MISIIALLLSLVVWGLIFWVLYWGLGQIAIAEPFNKVATVILVIAAVVIVLGLLMGSIRPFPIFLGL